MTLSVYDVDGNYTNHTTMHDSLAIEFANYRIGIFVIATAFHYWDLIFDSVYTFKKYSKHLSQKHSFLTHFLFIPFLEYISQDYVLRVK